MANIDIHKPNKRVEGLAGKKTESRTCKNSALIYSRILNLAPPEVRHARERSLIIT
jgi:hypothetical protein